MAALSCSGGNDGRRWMVTWVSGTSVVFAPSRSAWSNCASCAGLRLRTLIVADAASGMMLSRVPALITVRFAVRPSPERGKRSRTFNWWINSTAALRPSCGTTPAWDARPFTSML